MAEINLAPGTEYAALARRRRSRIFLLAAVIVILLLLSWGGIFLLTASLANQQQDLRAQLNAVDSEIVRLGEQAERVRLFEGRLQAIAGLLDNHIAWNPFLRDLERVLPPPATVTRLEVDVNNQKIELNGQTPDIDTVAQTLASLVSTSARPTIFTAADLQAIERQQQLAPDGQVINAYYTFSAKLILDSTRLRYGQ